MAENRCIPAGLEDLPYQRCDDQITGRGTVIKYNKIGKPNEEILELGAG